MSEDVIYLALDGLASGLVVREMFMFGILVGGLGKRLQYAKAVLFSTKPLVATNICLC